MNDARRHPNHLGLKGWAVGGRWGLERYLYTLHRITGLGLLAYFLAHVVVTSSRALGPEEWAAAMAAVAGPVFRIAEFLVFAAFTFHAVNGVRLVLVGFGLATGKAEEPVYPYRTSVDVQRPLTVAAMVLVAVLVAMGGYEFFLLGGAP